MGNDNFPSFDDLNNPDDSGPLYTETIDLGELRAEEADFFDPWEEKARSLPESINKLLHALPIPALLVNTAYNIIFLNESFRKISPKYRKLKGTPFLKLFPREEDARKVHELVDQVFVHRTPQVGEGIFEVQGARIWCRLNMRSLRFGRERAVLGLIEDLTLEKKQLLLNARHRKILRAARDELENVLRNSKRSTSG
jgi:PAS domain S-box-containing protein